MNKTMLTFKSKLTKKDQEYPSNSNRARKEEQIKRDKVIHSGGTRIGSFAKKD